MTVEILPGEGKVLLVSSESCDGTKYRVDLGENGGIGACQCEDFYSRCQPRINAGEPFRAYPHAQRTTCKHMAACTTYLGRRVQAQGVGREVEDIFGSEL